MPDLLPEILTLICDQLEHRQDFNSLFACALTSKAIAQIAIRSLYRIHSQSKALGRLVGDHFGEGSAFHRHLISYAGEGKKQDFVRGAILWKSLLLSRTGKTAFPYCLFIRTLDLCSLLHLLDHSDFGSEIGNYFQIEHSHKRPTTGDEYLELIGESLISCMTKAAVQLKTTITLERIVWHDNNGALTEWTSRLSKLKALEIQYTTPFDSGALAKSISDNCPGFRSFMLAVGRGRAHDPNLSAFFKGLKENTLQKLHLGNLHIFESETLLSISCHAESLTTLRINNLAPADIEKLYFLRSCKHLTSLQLSFLLSSDDSNKLKTTNNDLYQAIVDWICSCRGLRELSLGYLNDGTTILTEVCSKEWIRLQKLDFINIEFGDSKEFFKALSTQTTLEYLRLQEYPDGCGEDPENCLSSLSCLTNLKYLDINPMMCSGTRVDTIITLASHLSKLEGFAFACKATNDKIWPAIENLRHLRTLTITGTSYFSCDGILAFVNSLHETNKGLKLLIYVQEPRTSRCITNEHKLAIRNSLSAKVGGRFQIVYYFDSEEDYQI